MDERQLSPAIAQLHERVERLLLRHTELQRTNAMLTERLQGMEAERVQLRQRLQDATQRIDKLLLRLDQTHSIPGTPDTQA
jgi:chaperonin cofactor prefoldin